MSFEPTIQIVAFGESTFKGVNAENSQPNSFCVPDMVARSFGVGVNQPVLKVNNKAVSGRAVFEQLQTLTQDRVTLEILAGPLQQSSLISTRGNLVIINIGINDAWNGVDEAVFKSQLKSIVTTCKLMGKTVIVQSPNQVSTTEPFIDGSLIKNNLTVAQHVGHYARKMSELSLEIGFIYVNSHARFNFPRAAGDPWHPTNEGYGILKDDLLSVITPYFIKKLNGQFQVCLMYTSILGRLPEKSGFDGWVNHLLAGGVSFGDSTLVDGFLTSSEGSLRFPASQTNEEFVRAVYLKILGREALAPEIATWSADIRSGTRSVTLTKILHILTTYSVSGGTDPLGLASEALVLNRVEAGLASAVVFGRNVVDNPIPLGKLSTVTEDPLTVFNLSKSY